jgi:hypothetical protein
MVSGNFSKMTPFLRHLGIFYMPQICDMGPTALLPLLKEGTLRNFSPEKSEGFGRVLNPRTWVPEASMLTTRPVKQPYVSLYGKEEIHFAKYGARCFALFCVQFRDADDPRTPRCARTAHTASAARLGIIALTEMTMNCGVQ